MRVPTCLLFVFMTFGEVWAQDLVKTDSDKYRVVLENERVREFKPGEVMWTDAQSHIGENIGDTDTDVLIIELKEPRKAPTGGATPQ